MEKKFDVLVVGELNIDLILDGIQSFPEVGKEKLAEKMTLALGSSSAIFASNIASLGARVAFLGKVGKDKFGEMVLEELSKRKLDISMIVSDPNLATGITVVLNVEEDRANITYPGAMDHLTPDDIPDEALICSSHLHFSSCFLQAGMRKSVGRLFQRAKQYGLTTSFDMQWDPFEQWDLDMPGTLPYVDIFLPNEQELLALTGETALSRAIDVIRPYTNILAIKQGNRGSSVYHANFRSDMPAFLNRNVVDAIGAGDSFNAGFVYKFIQGKELEECQQFGNLTGAVSTTEAGGTAAFSDYRKFLEKARAFGVSL